MIDDHYYIELYDIDHRRMDRRKRTFDVALSPSYICFLEFGKTNLMGSVNFYLEKR